MKRRLFLLVLALQSAWVVGTIGLQEIRLRRAIAVLLEAVPVDPRDLVRGDFVVLSYKISRLDGKLFEPALTTVPEAGTRVYVTLAPDGDFYVAQAASLTRPESGDRPVLVGTVKSTPFSRPPSAGALSVDLDYGLERFYVREGTGTPLGKLTVRVSVPHSGQGLIQEVYIDGRPYAEVMGDVAR